jgi:CRISPR-associated endonuclease/helicase Cas3
MKDLESVIATAELLSGRPLYSWQARLLTSCLLQGVAPEAVDIPTGLGKTTVMGLWLAALAHGALLPRRLVYVVDRRAVVDQATQEAEDLTEILGKGDSTDGSVRSMRERLGLAPGQRLPVSTLRGQHVDNRQWLEHPFLPAIIVGTVDMIGSRLLFSGYGVSRRMRPVHAGLLGVDSLVVLDEAHLVPAFEALTRRIRDLRRLNGGGIDIPGFRVMALSATGRTETADRFCLSTVDMEDARVTARLQAIKRLRFLPDVSAKDLPGRLAQRAWELAQPSFSLLVFCNSRKTAVEVADLLRKRVREAQGRNSNEGVALLVGERRVHERRRLAESEVFRRFLPRGNKNAVTGTGPAFLVATSAGEVGVDVDADHMVGDLVPWERMVQRLGRVNRRAKSIHEATVEVVPAQLATGKEEAETAIDAERLATLRAPFQHAGWPASADGSHDASADTLYRLKQDPQLQAVMEAASTPSPFWPELKPPVVQAWSMTSLREHSGRPEVQPWLRGWVDDIPQTRIAWRRWFPLRGSAVDEDRTRIRDLQAFFDEASPHLTEILEAPTSRLLSLLRKRANEWLDTWERIQPAGADVDPKDAGPLHLPIVIVLDDAGDVEALLDIRGIRDEKVGRLQRLLEHRTVVIDARLGGLDAAGLLNAGEGSLPLTLDSEGDEWPDLPTIGFRVRAERASAVDAAWRVACRWPFDAEDESPDRRELRVEVWRLGSASKGDPALSRTAQELPAHVEAVAAKVRETAQRLCLSKALSSLLAKVAEVHDSGKGRDLWQRAVGAPPDGKIYAKTSGYANPRLLQIDGVTYRHEFGSLQDAVQSGAFADFSDELGDLGLHLIASHHGWARPVIAAVDPSRPPSSCPPLAAETALRFERLNREWGPWELAWIEALFRAGDWMASAEQQKDPKSDG